MDTPAEFPIIIVAFKPFILPPYQSLSRPLRAFFIGFPIIWLLSQQHLYHRIPESIDFLFCSQRVPNPGWVLYLILHFLALNWMNIPAVIHKSMSEHPQQLQQLQHITSALGTRVLSLPRQCLISRLRDRQCYQPQVLPRKVSHYFKLHLHCLSSHS